MPPRMKKHPLNRGGVCCVMKSVDLNGGTFPAYIDPFGHFFQPVREVCQSAGNVDLLGADLGTFAAADTDIGLFAFRQCFDPQCGIEHWGVAQVVVNGQQEWNVQTHGAAVATVPAGGAGNAALQFLGHFQNQFRFSLGNSDR